MNTRIYILIALCAIWGGLSHAQITIQQTVNYATGRAPAIDVFQANTRTFEWTVLNAQQAVDLDGTQPFMWWTDPATNGVVVAQIEIVNATAGVFRATFEPADLNYAPGNYTYAVGTEVVGGPTTARSGQFRIQADPFAAGSDQVQFITFLNWNLIESIGVPDFVFNPDFQDLLDAAITNAIAEADLEVDLTDVEFIGFSEQSGPTAERQLRWDDDIENLVYGLEGDQQVSVNPNVIRVRNNTGTPIPKHTIVRRVGQLGASRPKVEPFDNVSAPLGWTMTEIAGNGDGYILTQGYLYDVNTTGIGDDCLYAGPGGSVLTTLPDAPTNAWRVGCVVVESTGGGDNGKVLVTIHPIKLWQQLDDRYVQDLPAWIEDDQGDVALSGFDNDLTLFAPTDLPTDYGADWSTLTSSIAGKQPVGNYADGAIYQHDGGTATVNATVGVFPNRVRSASTTSVGLFGAAFGIETTAGDFGAAFGIATTAGFAGAAFGESSIAEDYGAAFGFDITAGFAGAAFGVNSTAGDFGFAAGRRGRGADGSFVFADNQNVDFDRTGTDDGFSVRASGGTYFETPTFEITGDAIVQSNLTAASFTLGTNTISDFDQIAADLSQWATEPAVQDVDAGGYAITNIGMLVSQTGTFDAVAANTITGTTFEGTVGNFDILNVNSFGTNVFFGFENLSGITDLTGVGSLTFPTINASNVTAQSFTLDGETVNNWGDIDIDFEATVESSPAIIVFEGDVDTEITLLGGTNNWQQAIVGITNSFIVRMPTKSSTNDFAQIAFTIRNTDGHAANFETNAPPIEGIVPSIPTNAVSQWLSWSDAQDDNWYVRRLR